MTTALTIGELALHADVAATTLRNYERIGLIQSPARVGGKRRYDESMLARLDVIRLCKATLSADRPAALSPRPNWPRSMRTFAEPKRAREIVEWARAAPARRSTTARAAFTTPPSPSIRHGDGSGPWNSLAGNAFCYPCTAS
jgi:hypothetical protein